MSRFAWLPLALVAALGCGTPPNEGLVTRAPSYLAALSLAGSTGHPLDISQLERKFPELKGIVITAAQWIEEYDKMREEAEKQGKAIHEFHIPFGASITIEVTGEPGLTRNYTVPPSGFVHYPYVHRLKVAGLTMDQIKENLERDLTVYLREPEVLIHVNAGPYIGLATPGQQLFAQSSGGSTITVMGVTSLPWYQNINFTGKETLVSVLGMTGLPTMTEWRQIRVIRRDAKDPLRKSRVIVCDLWDFVAKGDVRQDIPLVPGDVIFVPLRWSADDQFWEEWDYVRKVIDNVFFVDNFRDALKPGGELRD
jgi:polysaccharide export outer membrane protein